MVLKYVVLVPILPTPLALEFTILPTFNVLVVTLAKARTLLALTFPPADISPMVKKSKAVMLPEAEINPLVFILPVIDAILVTNKLVV